MVRYGLSWALFGAMLYLTLWFSHDRGGVPGFDEGPKWSDAPIGLRRLLRRRPGPILLVSALAEIAGIAMMVRGLTIAVGLGAEPLGLLTQVAMNGSILSIGVGFGWAYLQDWRGRQR